MLQTQTSYKHVCCQIVFGVKIFVEKYQNSIWIVNMCT